MVGGARARRQATNDELGARGWSPRWRCCWSAARRGHRMRRWRTTTTATATGCPTGRPSAATPSSAWWWRCPAAARARRRSRTEYWRSCAAPRCPRRRAPVRLLDNVNLVTGVSGGSFTALAYALYGDRLFEEYEQRFLKRNVQGDLIGIVLNPSTWPKILGGSFTRSDLAAEYYDRILFEGATFGDLRSRGGPFANVAATEVTTGARITFNQNTFDLLCSDLSSVRLARAAAASSAVPGVFAPVGFDNYAGTCGFDMRENMVRAFGPDVANAAPGRASLRDRELAALQDGVAHRYLHLIDGGLSDNVGLRTVLKAWKSR